MRRACDVSPYLSAATSRSDGMTHIAHNLVLQWAAKPDQRYVQNLRLHALPSPYRALAQRVASQPPR
jgi:hypothetical protein